MAEKKFRLYGAVIATEIAHYTFCMWQAEHPAVHRMQKWAFAQTHYRKTGRSYDLPVMYHTYFSVKNTKKKSAAIFH